ncbi:MAG TPA: hypothetical protein PKW90_04890 [Myxococcota bacterium]|nr:hypothetical protein [Myxococcota bacterium]
MIFLLLACASSLDLGRATPLEPGEGMFSSGGGLSAFTPALSARGNAGLPWFQAAAGYHRGVAPGLEIGGRGWIFGLPNWFSTVGGALDSKILLHRSGEGYDPHLSLAPNLLYHRPALGGAPWHILSLQLPLLVGWDLGPSQLVFSPRVAGWYATSYGQAPIWTASAGFGLALHIPVRKVELRPELSWSWAPLGFSGADDDPTRIGAGGIELGFGVAWRDPW